MADKGYLIVQASTARGAMPVVGAAVTVCGAGTPESCVRVRTDASGATVRMELDAPALTDAEQAPPFSSYQVDIDHPNYRPVTVADVAIFSGVTTALPVNLIPPRSAAEKDQRVYLNGGAVGPSGSGTEGA